MERLTLEDMIKALKCVGSQDSLGDCYADREVYMHMGDENYKRLVCGTGKDLYIKGTPTEGCPYYQKKYGVCLEDGDSYWLNEVAELLEELKSYKEAEEQGLLVRLPCKVGDSMFRINKGAKNPIIELIVTQIDITRRSYNLEVIDRDCGELMCFKNDIGKSVFLTHEEAEKKLEEIKNDKT